MIWSTQELARLAVCKQDVIADKFFAHLDEPDNQDIWNEENFSLVYGLLGAAGVKDICADVAENIWIMLNNNKVLDAYDKGILDDFNHRLMSRYNDERMRGWINLDNYTAGLKFRKTILLPLCKLSDKIRADADASYPNPDKLIERFTGAGDMVRLKTYLENIKPVVYDEALFGADVIFDKAKNLCKLAKAVAYMRRPLSEDEKNYLWYYFFDACNKGFLAYDIGVEDNFLAKLVAAPVKEDCSELDKALLQNRNDNIKDFLQTLENNGNFYEETEAGLLLFNPLGAEASVAKCLDFIKKSAQPCGVVFALTLINLKQIRSAVTVLAALAEKGRVTEACAYMHRLLPLAKGGEGVISELLKTNLLRVKECLVSAKNEAYQMYVSRYYLLAVKGFIENGYFKEGADLLSFAVNEAWFKQHGELADDFKKTANYLLALDLHAAPLIEAAVEALGFSVYYEENSAFVGDGTANPLTAARKRVEQSIKDVTTFDVSGILDKVAAVENSTYKAVQEMKNNFKKNNVAADATASQAGALRGDKDVSEALQKNDEFNAAAEALKDKTDEQMSPMEVVAQWKAPKDNFTDVKEESIIGELKQFKSKIKDKVHLDIDAILNVSASDIDKHFEKIKQAADDALNQAKEQVKEKVEKFDVAQLPAMNKVRQVAQKFAVKRKKDE